MGLPDRSFALTSFIFEASWTKDCPVESRPLHQYFVGLVFPAHICGYDTANTLRDLNIRLILRDIEWAKRWTLSRMRAHVILWYLLRISHIYSRNEDEPGFLTADALDRIKNFHCSFVINLFCPLWFTLSTCTSRKYDNVGSFENLDEIGESWRFEGENEWGGWWSKDVGRMFRRADDGGHFVWGIGQKMSEAKGYLLRCMVCEVNLTERYVWARTFPWPPTMVMSFDMGGWCWWMKREL